MRLALLLAASCVVTACSSETPTNDSEVQSSTEEMTNGSVLDGHEQRARENKENWERAGEDIFGSSPESSSSGGESQ